MPTKKLTALAIPTLQQGEWHDSVLPGLILRVGVKRRTWQFRYRAGGTYHRKPLGHFPAVELAQARDAARKLIERVDSGLAPPPPALHPRSAAALTVSRLLDQFEAMRTREAVQIKSLPKTMRLLRHNLKPYFALPAVEFSKADLREIRNALIEAGTPGAANKVLGSIGPVLRWAAEEDLIAANFASAIRRTPETARSRVLTKSEIAAVWHACASLGHYGRLVKFLILTAQRLDEAASLKFGDILDGTWRQIANKSDRPHSLTLPPLALDIVGHGGARDLVFPADGGGKIAAFSRWKRRLDLASGVSGWVVHDARRTAATNLQELGVRNEIVSAILNHSLPGVAAVYLRSELEQQKAEALKSWADALGRIVGPSRHGVTT
jgi:integrase